MATDTATLSVATSQPFGVHSCTEKPAERAKPVRHEEPRRDPGKFEGVATHAGQLLRALFFLSLIHI